MLPFFNGPMQLARPRMLEERKGARTANALHYGTTLSAIVPVRLDHQRHSGQLYSAAAWMLVRWWRINLNRDWRLIRGSPAF
jgi:hypothetical protein